MKPIQEVEGVDFRSIDGQDHIVSIVMVDNNLMGKFGDAASNIADLPSLESVILCNNKLRGERNI